MDERTAIGTTVEEIEATLGRLQAERAKLDEKIREKTQLLTFWQDRLSKLAVADGAVGPRRRLPRGEPMRRVTKTLTEASGRRMTIPAIAEATSLSWSTAKSVLERNPEVFDEVNGEWAIKGAKNEAA